MSLYLTNKVIKVAARVISGLAILIAVTWYYFEPGFEPVITSLVGIAGLLWTFIPPHHSKNNESGQFYREFDALKARWCAEKDEDGSQSLE